ncbi:SDR family oxidoreductase [Limnochorda pilosa]|uniref:Gluconate 2-dehydrogenase n=1 Tax=Limnochorda pilosa TaxID=1555112 RepID=A0A0K2SJQ5_LIMPI|nr:SDR family oxidoreductase [Limnochorda pilosa]BAS27325.1 gluconate 2-dehydrogenase [Limnochorda pilosa]
MIDAAFLSDLFGLDGHVALVTGGSRGLGLEMAEALGRAGARLALVARRAQWLDPAVESLRAAGMEAAGWTCDVADPDGVARVVEAAEAELGPISVLVNAAGRSWGAPALEMPLERWREVMEANATGAFVVSQAVGRRMRVRGYGRIIHVTSVAGLAGSPPEVLDAVGYSASKGAIVALTRDLAVKWARYGITVNAMAPGYFPTRMSAAVIEQAGEALTRAVPLGRVGQAGELRATVLFLASRASSYVTGQILAVDGGMSAM